MKIGNELEFLKRLSQNWTALLYIFLSRGQVIEFSYIDKMTEGHHLRAYADCLPVGMQILLPFRL